MASRYEQLVEALDKQNLFAQRKMAECEAYERFIRAHGLDPLWALLDAGLIDTEQFRQASCAGKRRYHSKSDAKRAMKGLESRIKGGGLNVYQCYFCGQHHVGHKMKGTSHVGSTSSGGPDTGGSPATGH